MDRKVIHGELARICGWNNGILGYEIDTTTNRVRYVFDAHRQAGGNEMRYFDRYADAVAAFDAFNAEYYPRKGA